MILSTSIVLLGWSAWSQTSFTIPSPRGNQIEILAHIPQQFDKIMVVAPGQSCNSRTDLFQILSHTVAQQRTAVFRMEWEYCKINPSKPTPSPNYEHELQDLSTVLRFASNKSRFPNKQITLAGKSLGSFLAYKIFQLSPQVKSIVLLTPICSVTHDENDNPLPRPLNVGEKYYPQVKSQPRPVLFALGNRDSACVLPVLRDFLKDSPPHIRAAVFAGDHGFRSYLPNGEIDKVLMIQTLHRVAHTVVRWLALQ